MFCYTEVSGIKCVLQELVMWSDISSEHPTFIKTVAGLTNKNLRTEIISELDRLQMQFKSLKDEAQSYLNQMMQTRLDMVSAQKPMQPAIVAGELSPVPVVPHSAYPYQTPIAPVQYQQPYRQVPQTQMQPVFVGMVRRLLDRFLELDRMFLDLLKKVRKYGTEDKVWQTLLEHITHEQQYMYRLMNTLRSQLR